MANILLLYKVSQFSFVYIFVNMYPTHVVIFLDDFELFNRSRI